MHGVFVCVFLKDHQKLLQIKISNLIICMFGFQLDVSGKKKIMQQNIEKNISKVEKDFKKYKNIYIEGARRKHSIVLR